ncbi:hypothetical protein H0H87_012538 [Tephrocybe sp. NHM501043]|nr:hypothetical protein H0H87_012538 [Tephrocybe sp. NHM501043]
MTPEAFLLLNIPNATVSVAGTTQTGTLSLECVTIQVPDTSNPTSRDVYLVLRLGTIELPIDPARIIQKVDGNGYRAYSFQPTESDPTELSVSVPLIGSTANPYLLEDIGTFEAILAQYAADLRSALLPSDAKAPITHAKESIGLGFPGSYGDLRGHLVVINQDNGEVVGQFDKSTFNLDEDPRLHEYGHENDAVIIEVPDNRPGHEQDATALQMFARAVPADQQDWITKSATIVRQAHLPSCCCNAPPTPLPRALVFLTSEKTRKGLAGVHAVSSQAVKVSSKTITAVDGMIRRAMGSKPKRERQFQVGKPTAPIPLSPAPSYHGALSPQYPARTPSPSYAHLSPSPGSLSPTPGYSGVSSPANKKPPLPPRRSPSPIPPLPPRTHPGSSQGVPIAAPQPHVPLSKKERVLLSADLIFSTLDHDTRRLLDAGTASISSIVGHKYGPEAAETSQLLTGTARNVGLVYVDMRGIGRRALLKSAGKQFIRGRLSSNNGQQQKQDA